MLGPGGSGPRGCLVPGEVWSQRVGVPVPGGSGPRGVVVSQHALRQPPPCGQTDTCKNITFATSLRTVINKGIQGKGVRTLHPILECIFYITNTIK